MLPTWFRIFVLCALCAPIFSQAKTNAAESALVRVAILPFENLTPNPNIDWISNLFVDSYKGALNKRYRYADVSPESTAKALELFDEYRLSGKTRFQVFAALTGADVVIGGSFAPSGNEAILIESQLYSARTNQLQNLHKQSASLESSQLFPALDRSAQAAIELLGAGQSDGNDKPALHLPYLPRLLLYSTVDVKDKKAAKIFAAKLDGQLADAETRDFVHKHLEAIPEEKAEQQRLAAELMRSESAAYVAVVSTKTERGKASAELSLYSPLKAEALARFTASGKSEQAALLSAAEQLAIFIRGWRFNPKISIEGLKGKDLTIEFSSLRTKETSANGELDFAMQISLGAGYDFKVVSEPSKPSQRCFVVRPTGKVTITGIDHATVVCITKRYAVEGTVEGLTGGEVSVKLGKGESITLRENAAFRFLETLEDFEQLNVAVEKTPTAPPQQCAFISPPARVTGAKVKLRLYCMPLTQHWLSLSVNYPILQGNSARSENLVPNASFPLNALSGRFGITAGYWARYYLRYGFLLGGEATYAYLQGTTDLYTSTGFLVEGNQVLHYHAFGANGLLGYTVRLKGDFLSKTELVPFVGAGPRYVSLRTGAPVTLLGMLGPGATAGFNWSYKWTEGLQVGLRYHADLVYISGEPVILQHAVGLQMGLRL